MTFVIGKPPAPKGGATFGDVPIASDERDMRALFINDAGVILQRCGERAARCFGLKELYGYGLHQPVTLLDITPRDSEPDPAVCTSDGLTKGQWYEGADGALTLRGDVIDLDVNGESDDHLPPGDPATFRRVAASVVVHEEPGTALVLYSSGDIELMPEHGSRHVSREQLAAVVRQGAALLAQEPASPESGEPESAGMCPCGLDSKSHPSFKHAESCPMAKPAPRWTVTRDDDDTWSTTRPDGVLWSVDHVSEASALDETWRCHRLGRAGTWTREDRSKPAPGYETGHLLYYPDGDSVAFDSRAEAVAASWRDIDAQQAGKGGES